MNARHHYSVQQSENIKWCRYVLQLGIPPVHFAISTVLFRSISAVKNFEYHTTPPLFENKAFIFCKNIEGFISGKWWCRMIQQNYIPSENKEFCTLSCEIAVHAASSSLEPANSHKMRLLLTSNSSLPYNSIFPKNRASVL